MITRQQIEADTRALLTAGPERWPNVPGISAEARWLSKQARERALRSDLVLVRFAELFAMPEGWRELAEVVKHCHALLETQAFAHARWRNGHDPDIRDMWPESELILVFGDPLTGWQERWKQCGGRVVNGRCIANKEDKVWARFSEFGQPFAPFEWTGRLDVRDVELVE